MPSAPKKIILIVGVQALWATAAQLNLIVELHIDPNYARDARQLIEAFSHKPVLIDPLCEPSFGTIAEYDDVLALAELPNLTMKLSGLSHVADDATFYLSIAGLTRILANTFDRDRLA